MDVLLKIVVNEQELKMLKEISSIGCAEFRDSCYGIFREEKLKTEALTEDKIVSEFLKRNFCTGDRVGTFHNLISFKLVYFCESSFYTTYRLTHLADQILQNLEATELVLNYSDLQMS